MELKPQNCIPKTTCLRVLIVPFMELKLYNDTLMIKTQLVLIVPFMELKQCFTTFFY